MSEPTCDFCGGLHYGSPSGYCSFRCPHCGGDMRPTEAVPDGFVWEHTHKDAGRMVKQSPDRLMPETKVSVADEALDKWWHEDHFGDGCDIGPQSSGHSEDCVSLAFTDGYSAGQQAAEQTIAEKDDALYTYGLAPKEAANV